MGFSAGAQSPIEHNDQSFVIDMDNRLRETTPNTQIFESIRPIMLQVTPQSLIGDIDKIETLESGELIVLDKRKAKGVYVFDSNGKFIRRIGLVGRGPQEYISPSDFTIDHARKQIYILDADMQKIVKFDLSTGKGLANFRINQEAAVPQSYHIYYSDGAIYTDLYYYNRERSGGYHLLRVNAENGAFMDYYLDADSYSDGIVNENRIHNPFFKIDDSSCLFAHPLMDTVFLIGNGKVTNYLTLSTSKKIGRSERRDLLSKNTDGLTKILMASGKPTGSDFIVMPERIYFVGMEGMRVETLLYDIRENRTTKVIADVNLLYRDDYRGARMSPSLGCVGNGGVYKYNKSVVSSFFLKALEAGGLQEGVQSQLAELNEDSNPLVFFYKFSRP